MVIDDNECSRRWTAFSDKSETFTRIPIGTSILPPAAKNLERYYNGTHVLYYNILHCIVLY